MFVSMLPPAIMDIASLAVDLGYHVRAIILYGMARLVQLLQGTRLLHAGS